MTFGVLGSGSGGNSAVVRGPEGLILIDAGLSARQIRDRMAALGLSTQDLAAVLLTHEHGDHTRGLDVLMKGELDQVPVFANTHTAELVRRQCRFPKRWKLVETGAAFEVAGLVVQTFPVPHDAADPMGFVLENRASRSRLGVVSDLGHCPPPLLGRLRDLDALFIEANYCPDLLAGDTRRPWGTKQRIASRHGHLSNEQCAEIVAQIALPRLRRLLLGHLSSDCKCPTRAATVIARILEEKGLPLPEIHCACQHEPTGIFSVTAPPLPAPAPIEGPAFGAQAMWQLEFTL